MNELNLTRRTVLGSGLALGTGALLAACSGASSNDAEPAASDGSADAEPTGAEGSEKELTKLLFCLVAHSIHAVPIYLAIDHGFFAEEGIELEFYMPADDYGDMTIGTGTTPLGMEWQEYIGGVRGKENPLPITAIATFASEQCSGFLSLKETGIETPKDLEGKTYGGYGLPLENALVSTMVEYDGGDPSKIEFVPMTSSDIALGLKAGMFDCAWGWWDTDGLHAQAEGLDINFFPVTESDPALNYYTPVIAANEDWLAENPDLARAFLRAVARGAELANTDAEASYESLKNYAPEMDDEYARLSSEFTVGALYPEGTQWGYIDEDQWSGFFAWMNEHELTEVPLDPTEGFTNEYLS